MALADRVSTTVDRASFDDLVTLVTQAPPWEKDRLPGGACCCRRSSSPTHRTRSSPAGWRLARATRKAQDRAASAEFAEAKRLLGALANSRGHRHEENAAKLVAAARQQPLRVAAALLASADGYTPRSTKLLDAAREDLGTVHDVAGAWPRISRSRSLPAAPAGAGAARSAAQEQRLRRTAPTRHRPPSRNRSAGGGDLPRGSLLGRVWRNGARRRLAADEREQAVVLLTAGRAPSRCARRPGMTASASSPASSSST